MPRPTEYRPEEDQIILATSGQPFHVTNEILVSQGFPPRTAAQVKSRRKRINQKAGGATAPAALPVIEAAKADATEPIAERIARLKRTEQGLLVRLEYTRAEIRGLLTEHANNLRQAADAAELEAEQIELDLAPDTTHAGTAAGLAGVRTEADG